MKTILFFILTFCFTYCWSKPERKLPDLANEAFANQNVDLSLKLYEQIALNTANQEERSKALEKICYIFSQFYQNYDSAVFYASKNLRNSRQYV